MLGSSRLCNLVNTCSCRSRNNHDRSCEELVDLHACLVAAMSQILVHTPRFCFAGLNNMLVLSTIPNLYIVSEDFKQFDQFIEEVEAVPPFMRICFK